MRQTYRFLDVSEELSVEPDGGFGELEAGEVAELRLVFSPVRGEGRRQMVLRVDTALGAACATASRASARARTRARRRAQAGSSGSKVPSASAHACSLRITAEVVSPMLQVSAHRVRFPVTPVGSHSTAEFTMTCLSSEARFTFKTPDDQIQVLPPAGSLLQGQIEAQVRVTCEAETLVADDAEWRHESIPVLALCRATPASLTPVSQAVEFGAVAAGCTACRVARWLNSSASWLRVRPALAARTPLRPEGEGGCGDSAQQAAAAAAFHWPTLAVLLPPGHELHL
ncbi:Cilia- and flagella-associated protein 74, partial [Frankliniella fusca]